MLSVICRRGILQAKQNTHLVRCFSSGDDRRWVMEDKKRRETEDTAEYEQQIREVAKRTVLGIAGSITELFSGRNHYEQHYGHHYEQRHSHHEYPDHNNHAIQKYYYHNNGFGEIKIHYPDGYKYHNNGYGEITITGPDYYYHDDGFGDIEETGTMDSRYRMGSKL
jgi:hypothetical protein